ncbi:hypothetical protein IAT38_003944 [Cryptococcus sp. DSM 104549]
MRAAALLALLPSLASAAVVVKRTASASDYVGAATSDVFPPANTKVNSELFPGESVVGYPGPTATGVQPAAAQTAASFASNDGPSGQFPLVADQPNDASENFDTFKYWGKFAPWYSVDSSFYGLNDTSPLVPDQCSITQVHLLYRHGARYPTSGAPPAEFADKLANSTKQDGGFTASGDLSFLNDWTFKLGEEYLTPFGRLQEFELGVSMRQQYGVLLNNFTEQGALPVFRTQSQDRMVDTTVNFAAGFFGVPEYMDQVNIEIVVESPGLNNSGAPYSTCPNANLDSRGYLGTAAAANFSATAFADTVERIQGQIDGVNITVDDIQAMLQLCSYETVALGYSAFCKLFTEEDSRNYEYAFDLMFYYEQGFGSPVGAAQGKAYLQEFVARFTQTPITASNSALNLTLDVNSTYFPLNQSIYADATHEVVLLDAITAFNLTALFSTGALPVDKRVEDSSFVASHVVPFATHLVIQVLECADQTPSKQIRFMLNDAVLPIDQSYEGCEWNKDGLCSFDTVVENLQRRLEEIDFDYDCYGNYTVEYGQDLNGRAPRS